MTPEVLATTVVPIVTAIIGFFTGRQVAVTKVGRLRKRVREDLALMATLPEGAARHEFELSSRRQMRELNALELDRTDRESQLLRWAGACFFVAFIAFGQAPDGNIFEFNEPATTVLAVYIRTFGCLASLVLYLRADYRFKLRQRAMRVKPLSP